MTGFVVLMGIAWLMATPPGSAPDEPAHYVKAIGAGHGDLYGEPYAITAAERRAFAKVDSADLALLARESSTPAARWQRRTTRQFAVPRSLVAPTFGCTFFGRERTGACLDAPSKAPLRSELGTYAGTYQPYAYVPPGLAMRVADSPRAALRLGRAASLALSAALLIAAIWLAWSPAAPWLSLLGVLAAVTPMVLFLASVLNPSGPEVAAAICFAVALIRLTRAEVAPGWAWAALAAAGVVLAAARALGPAFVLLDVVAVGLLAGPRLFAGRVRDGGAKAIAAAGAIAVAAAASVVWEFTRQPRPEPSTTSLFDALRPAIDGLPEVGRQAVGVFGTLDVTMPEPAYWLWALLALTLVGAAAAVGTRRDRLSVGGLVAGALVVTVGMALVYREIGPLHGRYALPALVLVPLWSGEILLRRRDRLSESAQKGLVAGTFGLVAAVHAVAWWANGRRFAVGADGDWLFLADAAWRPPLGWIPWLCLMLVAVLAVAAGGVAQAGRAVREA